MGYSTRYTFEIIYGPDLGAFRRRLTEEAGVDPVDFDDTMKWYRHEDDITTAMVATGTTSVDLHGEGEENGDVWDKEFRLVDGRVEVKTFRYKLVRDKEPS